MNYLHPIFHGHAYQVGSRIDIERLLPVRLEDEDCDLLIDDYSEPQRFLERYAPVSTRIGAETIRGRNWTELMVKTFRVLSRIFTNVTLSIHQTMQMNFSQRGMVPFLSIDFDADALNRIIEMDFETSENTYGRLMELYSKGVLSPVMTIPFHIILPLLHDEYYVRMIVRIALDFYWPIVRSYHRFLRKVHNEKQFVLACWLPEGGYTTRVLEIVKEEYYERAKTEKIIGPHLLLLLDNFQCTDEENDVLMKSWNVIHTGKSKTDVISIVFRDRNFSDWVTYSKPSVKKLLDRTIAKVDSELNESKVDYSWAHFEDVHALCYSHQAARNFEQKVIKLTELGYMPVSPDVFIRRKLTGKFGKAKYEPRKVKLLEASSWRDWHSNNLNFGRWLGVLDSNAETQIVDENHRFFRYTKGGQVEEQGPQCWKIAYNKTLRYLTDFVLGDNQKMNSGMLGVLAELSGQRVKSKAVQQVNDFVIEYAKIYWREHFMHHGWLEGDLNLRIFCDEKLCGSGGETLSEEQVIIAGTAAQAFYFMLHAHKSFATHWENLDQRAVYQNVVMMALGLCNAAYVFHWLERPKDADLVVKEYNEYLVNFKNGYNSFKLADYGVKKPEWIEALKSFIDDSELNVVERAARRIAARHLRPLGYKKEFPKEDENISTNVGHIWSNEIDHSNFIWDNKLFCGVEEE